MSIEFCIQFLLTFLVTYVKQSHGLQSHTTDLSSVGAGNYTYYVLKFQGPILLTLETLDGDADLYVSEINENPTFDLEQHSMSSWTFGSEVLYIPKIFGRPVYIGVYGHPRYQESRYILTANFLEDEEYDPYKIKVEFDAKAQNQPRDNDKDSKSPKVKLDIIYF